MRRANQKQPDYLNVAVGQRRKIRGDRVVSIVRKEAGSDAAYAVAFFILRQGKGEHKMPFYLIEIAEGNNSSTNIVKGATPEAALAALKKRCFSQNSGIGGHFKNQPRFMNLLKRRNERMDWARARITKIDGRTLSAWNRRQLSETE
jgi:hypothetical protein